MSSTPRPGIGAVEPDGRIVVLQRPLIERLGVLRDWGGRPALDVREDCVEEHRSLLGEVLDVLLEVTVVDGEEGQVVVLERHPMSEMQRPKRIRRLAYASSRMDSAASIIARPCPDLMDMYVSKGALRGVAGEARRTRARLDVLHRSVLVREVRIERLADVILQPFDDALRVASHGRGGRVVHVFEDGVEQRAGALHEPLDVLVRPRRRCPRGREASRLPRP